MLNETRTHQRGFPRSFRAVRASCAVASRVLLAIGAESPDISPPDSVYGRTVTRVTERTGPSLEPEEVGGVSKKVSFKLGLPKLCGRL